MLSKAEIEAHLGRAMNEAECFAYIIHRTRNDPALFNKIVLGRTLWSKQIEVCEVIAKTPITLVPAGRAVGKSFLIAGIVLWWLYTRKNSLVITTGPDHRQVVTVLWKEIKRAINEALLPLEYKTLSEGLSSPQRLEITKGSDWCALGYAAGSGEGFSGQHSSNLLVVCDEASGISEEIWGAIHGLATTRMVVVGNPIRFDSHFRELHDLAVKGSPNIKSVQISSLEVPDAENEHSAVGMASKSFLRQMAEIHGIGSPWWRANILAMFPGEETVRFIPKAWLDACTDENMLNDPQWIDTPRGPRFLGVDVGGGVGADRSVCVVRDRKQLLYVFASSEHGVLDDAKHRLEPEVVRIAKAWDVSPDNITYDKGGIGRNFGSYLANYGIDGALGYFGSGRGGTLYANRRAANYFAFRRLIDPNRDTYCGFYCGGIPEWTAMRQELAEIRSADDEMDEGSLKAAIETKEELMGRLHRSPDLADSLAMTFSRV
jgi:hypothetical protein